MAANHQEPSGCFSSALVGVCVCLCVGGGSINADTSPHVFGGWGTSSVKAEFKCLELFHLVPEDSLCSAAHSVCVVSGD